MPADRIEGKRGTLLVRRCDFPVRDETELDQRLESVADTANQAESGIQQICQRFADSPIAEERLNEFSGTIRFISAGESAGNKQDL